MASKKCRRCKERKSLKKFAKDNYSKDGRYSRCIRCCDQSLKALDKRVGDGL